ncbi:MAG TPA: dethiobiotin synthase [Dokdonella sp.]|uniref:dethiobiotin synthase n=1 Tax=Dokdonella sp. TaxID=2291710 RepID=UPI002D80FAC3|nr:dethiobiotin synthase [Dokdonella sp.]HET9032296.1 dethiobiotin synthase [Dokdonella sp.]
MRSVFVSGTDTGIGKTHVSCALLRSLQSQGVKAIGMKPVASGCEQGAAGLRNEDALALIAASHGNVDYASVNPYAFEDPISPHLAAADNSVSIEPGVISAAYQRLQAQADFVVVEGVGGWLAPLGNSLMQADLVHQLRLPVLLVVGLRLGCLNHALLTARAIEADGCRLIGWIGNRIDAQMLRIEDNVETLKRRIQAPLLGIVEHEDLSRAEIGIDRLDEAARVLLASPDT